MQFKGESMVVLHMLSEVVSVMVAALAGNWVGGQIRSGLMGQPVQSVRFQYTLADGRTVRNIPVVTKFYPALFGALLGKPRWLYAFLGGCAMGGLVSDRYERLLWRLVFENALPLNDTPAQDSAGVI
jgi:hypothetical protein